MPSRRASRFALEVLFLVGLAFALAVADLRPLVIAGVMLLGWLVVALLEWAAWRDEPHYGRGLPPRYYVPQVSLPPRRPLEQVAEGYPAAEQRDEAPTWIASAALRAEVLGEWPVAPAPRSAGEETQDSEAERERDGEREPVVEAEAIASPEEDGAAPVEAEVEAPVEDLDAQPVVVIPPPRRRFWQRMPVAESADGDSEGSEALEAVDPWLVAELPVEPEPAPEPEAPAEPEPALDAEPPVEADAEVEAAPEAPVVALPTATQRTASHRLDPLAGPARRRWPWQRRNGDDAGVASVPVRPAGARALPGNARREG